MCLIIYKPAGVIIESEWLKDFHKRNRDGFGFMFMKDGKLVVHKELGDAALFEQRWREFEENEFFVHLRMRTHGDIDLENCHPYQVFSEEEGGELWLMHNGVLRTGNDADKTKSDTWHYIHKYLRRILSYNRELLFDSAFQSYLAEHIGSGNRFAFLNYDGRSVIVAKRAGVEWRTCWMSNTYAWSYSDRAGLPKVHVPAQRWAVSYNGLEWDRDDVSGGAPSYWEWYDREVQGATVTPMPPVSKKTSRRRRRAARQDEGALALPFNAADERIDAKQERQHAERLDKAQIKKVWEEVPAFSVVPYYAFSEIYKLYVGRWDLWHGTGVYLGALLDFGEWFGWVNAAAAVERLVQSMESNYLSKNEVLECVKDPKSFNELWPALLTDAAAAVSPIEVATETTKE